MYSYRLQDKIPMRPTGVPMPYPNAARDRDSAKEILFFDEADALFGRRTEVND